VKTLKQIIILSGIVFGFASALVMFVTFLAAFFSGHYSVMLFINRAGEAHFEIVLISVLIAVIALAFILYVRDLWKEK
jgi:hypothetical protein